MIKAEFNKNLLQQRNSLLDIWQINRKKLLFQKGNKLHLMSIYENKH